MTLYEGVKYPYNQTYSNAAVLINNEFKTYILPVSAVFGMFACTGILGNLFVFYVHIFKYKNCNFRFFVLGLCAVDLVSSVTILPLEIYTQLNWYVFPSQWLCKLKAFMNAFTSVSSVYVLLLIAIDRHRKICAPYSWQLTNQSVLIGYGVFFTLACCQCWPVLIVWGLQPGVKQFRGTEVIVTVCSTDPAVKNTPWPNVFIGMMSPHFLGMMIMLILYVLVGKQIFGVVLTLRRQSSLQKHHSMPKSALKKAKSNDLPDSDRNYNSPEISVGGDSSEHDVVRDSVRYDDAEGRNGEALNISPSPEQIAKPNERLQSNEKSINPAAYNSTLDRHYRQRTAKSQHARVQKNLTRKISIESKESTDMDLVIYEIQDHGISIKKSKIAKNPKKKKRNSKRNDSNKKKPKYTDSLKRRVRFSVSARDKLRRRTLITFVFTAIFIGTTLMYIIFTFRVANENATQALSYSQLAAFLFIYRLYFINSVIHPVIYGFLDPRFRKTLKTASKMVVDSVIRNVHEHEHREDRE